MAPSDALPDGPEADLLDQQAEVDPASTASIDASQLTRDPEVPEADALEQAQDVPLPYDERG